MISIEVVYASPQQERIFALQVPPGTTIEQAITLSGVREQFPEIPELPSVGVFSQPKKLHEEVFSGDRIEIYRPLLIDPKKARMERVNSVRKKRH
jgi:putative ubiquitin-RnfH superfamily antitoxin RatB of RatAB toxin-antitoxin module